MSGNILIIEAGQKFGRWTVVATGLRNGGKRASWCICECGNEQAALICRSWPRFLASWKLIRSLQKTQQKWRMKVGFRTTRSLLVLAAPLRTWSALFPVSTSSQTDGGRAKGLIPLSNIR
jgi:hypothetical protein